MSATTADPVAAFYERHPYPPPVREGAGGEAGAPPAELRAEHHRIWPGRPVGAIRSVLVAGCGTAQAVRHARRRPEAHVVGIDVSAASLGHTRALAARHGVTNLELHRLAIEDVARLGERFDHVVCTGVLHHLAEPAAGLEALRDVLAPGGAVTLMVYARYGRAGVTMLRDYCRRLGVGTSPAELADLVATLRELPLAHPLRPLLGAARDFATDAGLADALCNPRERTYDVAELYALLGEVGLRFGRWERQAAYLPDRGAIAGTPHGARVAARPAAEQHALVELFRGTITRHTAIAVAAGDTAAGGPPGGTAGGALDFAAGAAVDRWVPVRVPTAVAVEERLPAGAAAALLDRGQPERDLVLFVDQRGRDLFAAVDGHRSVGELGPGAAALVEQLWRHDLVVLDTTRAGGTP